MFRDILISSLSRQQFCW